MYNLKEINKRIGNRENCFYWQTDRKISAEEAAMIWKDRHSAILNEELLTKINNLLIEDKVISIQPLNEQSGVSLGNVNSVRIGVLESGEEIIIRCHPKGVKNEYFYVESLACKKALEKNIPVYTTLGIHELENEEDISFQLTNKLEGEPISFYLKKFPEKEEHLVFEMGKMMAKIHKIEVSGYGPFSNEEAKKGKLIGIHSTYLDAVVAGLKENLERLVMNQIISAKTAAKIEDLFNNTPLLTISPSVLIHNDFADWNLLTDKNKITGVIDWDECVAGNPIGEIACWSTFFEPERIQPFLKGYFSETPKYEQFDEIFPLLRLRYTISKMALRVKRYTYEQTPFLKKMIANGKMHLEELVLFFDLEEEAMVKKKKQG